MMLVICAKRYHSWQLQYPNEDRSRRVWVLKTFRVWHARTLDDGLRVGPEGGEELVENGGVHGADRRTVEGLEAGEDGAVHGGRAGAREGGGDRSADRGFRRQTGKRLCTSDQRKAGSKNHPMEEIQKHRNETESRKLSLNCGPLRQEGGTLAQGPGQRKEPGARTPAGSKLRSLCDALRRTTRGGDVKSVDVSWGKNLARC